MKRVPRRRMDVNLKELDQVLDGARQAPLSEPDYQKLKTTLHALVELVRPRSTEKTSAVLGNADAPSGLEAQPKLEGSPDASREKQPGHGRNAAAAFAGARKVEIAHSQLKPGDHCPGCPTGKVYAQKEPKTLVRIVGQAPLAATVYDLQRLRCNLCGQVFTAEEPEGVGPEKYDESAAAMIAQLKYGSGMPFYQQQELERGLGIPLPAATQWEIVEEAAEVIKPARDELVVCFRQACVRPQGDGNSASFCVNGGIFRRFRREPGCRGSSTASMQPGSPRVLERAAATRSGSRTRWHRTIRRCESES